MIVLFEEHSLVEFDSRGTSANMHAAKRSIKNTMYNNISFALASYT